MLSAAQFSLPVELAAVSSVDPSVAVLTELKALQDAIRKFQAMGVDPTEYACLRAIILLKTTLDSSHSPGGKSSSSNSSPNGGRSGANAEAMPVKELRDQAAINALQDQAHSTLSKYIASTYPNQPTRFGKLLLLLPALKTVSAKGIEEVFFKRTIGTIPLEKIICDMFKAGAV